MNHPISIMSGLENVCLHMGQAALARQGSGGFAKYGGEPEPASGLQNI